MLRLEPAEVHFRDVQLHHAYTAALSLTNTLNSAVDCSLKTSSPARYTVTPDAVRLDPGKSCTVQIRLYIQHFPNTARGRQGHKDTLLIKSAYFEQKTDLTFFLDVQSRRETGVHRNQSLSPKRSRQRRTDPSLDMSPDTLVPSPKDVAAPQVDMQAIIQQKDRQIVDLQGLVEQLQSEHPSIQEIVSSHIARERRTFEEKSEKVLKILRRKDDTIMQLQKQLHGLQLQQDESDKEKEALEHRVQELLQLQASSGRSDSDAFVRRQEKHFAPAASTTVPAAAAEETPELQALRAQCEDQTEQIEVLVTEIASLRNEITARNSTKEELQQLRTELTRARSHVEELKQINAGLEQSFRFQREAVAESAQTDGDDEPDPLLDSSRLDKSATLEVLRVSLRQERQKFHDAEARCNTLQQRLAEKDEQHQVLSENYHKLEVSAEQLRNMLAAQEVDTNDLTQQLRSSKAQLQAASTVGEEQAGDAESLRSKLDNLQAEMQRKEVELQEARHKLSTRHQRMDKQEAHQWWSYVWHMCKQQQQQQQQPSQHFAGSDVYGQESDKDVQLARYDSLVREQAAQLVLVRQQLLAQSLGARRENEHHMDKIDRQSKEIAKAQHQLRTHKSNGEVRLTELQNTVRILSGRSELHAQVALLRQDLEGERVCNNQLQSDVRMYKELLERTQANNAELEKQVRAIQQLHDTHQVGLTVQEVPGADPASLLEEFSAAFVRMQRECSTFKAGGLGPAPTSGIAANRVTELPAELGDEDRDDDSDNADSHSQTLGSCSEPSTIRNILHAMRYPQTSLDYEKVLEALGSGMLGQQIWVMEQQFHLAQRKMDERTQQLLESEKKLMEERDDIAQELETARAQWQRRYELLQTELTAAKQNTTTMREQIKLLTSNVQQLELAAVAKSHETTLPKATDRSQTKDMRSSSLDTEIKKLQSTLRERTAQVKVLTETIETMQLSTNSIATNPATTEDVATGNPQQDSWAVQALIRRVVVLTNELSSAAVVAGGMERKLNHMEQECLNAQNEAEQASHDQEQQARLAQAHQVEAAALRERITEIEQASRKELNRLQQEIDILRDRLLEEGQRCKQLTLVAEEYDQFKRATSDSLKQTAQAIDLFATATTSVEDDTGFDRFGVGTHDQPVHTEASDSGVRQMISTLVLELRKDAASRAHRQQRHAQFQDGQPKQSSAAQRSEKLFFHRVVELVLGCHQKCLDAETYGRKADTQRALLQNKLSILEHNFRTNLHTLHLQASKLQTLQATNDQLQEHLLRQGLAQFSELTATNADLQQRVGELTRTVIQTRYEHRKATAILAQTVASNQGSQKKLSEVELQLATAADTARFGLLQQYRDSISEAEQNMKKWFDQELPRLISGLPITEDLFASRPLSQQLRPDANAGVARSDLDIDSTYALAQALCATKATLAAEQLRVTEYDQQLITSKSLLRSTRAELEQIQHRELFHVTVTTWLERGFEKVEAEIQQLHVIEESAARLEQESAHQHAELETKLAQSVSALQQSTQQVADLKGRIKMIQDELAVAQQQHSQQLARQRVEANSQHAQELRAVKEAYEQEKFDLVQALEEVSSATVNLVTQGVDHTVPFVNQPNHQPYADAQPQEPVPRQRLGHNGLSSGLDYELEGENHAASTGVNPTLPSDSVDSADAQEQKAALDECHALLHESTEKIADLQAQLMAARRSLSMEQARVEDYQDQIKQLEQIVDVQREQIRHVSSWYTAAQQPRDGDQEDRDIEVGSRKAVVALEQLERSVADEDADLWPTSIELIEEGVQILLKCLRHQAGQGDADVHSALLMILRARKALTLQASVRQSSPHEAVHVGLQSALNSPTDADYAKGFAEVNHQLRQLEEEIQEVDRASVLQSTREIVSRLHEDLESFMASREQIWQTEHQSLRDERQRLLDQLQAAEALASTQSITLKERYEKALHEVEEALELQRDATQCELDRQQRELSRMAALVREKDEARHRLELQLLQQQQQQQHQLEGEWKSSGPHQASPQHEQQQQQRVGQIRQDVNNDGNVNSEHRQQAEANRTSQSWAAGEKLDADQRRMEELEQQVTRLQDLLEQSADGTFLTERPDRTNKQQHEEEIKELKRHFQKFSEAQGAIVRSLEEQLADMQRPQPRESGVGQGAESEKVGLLTTLIERDSVISGLRSQLRRLQSQYRVKTAEMDALIASIGSPVETSNATYRTFRTPSADHEGSEVSSSEQYSSPTVFAVLTEARNAAIDKELESLHRMVDKHTQQQLEMSRQLDQSHDQHDKQEAARYKNAPSRVHVLLQRLNEVKRNARTEVAGLKNRVAELEAELPSKEELRHLRRRAKELQDTVQLLREDNNRKSKLLNALRQGRSADESAVERWKLEATKHDTKAKELARALSSKEAVVQQLRSKLSEIEQAPVDKSTEAEKEESDGALRKLQNKCNLLQSKVRHLEADRSKLQQEIERTNRSSEQESSKQALQRKDAAIQSLRVRLTKVKEEYDNYREKAEHAALELERKLSTATRKLDDREKRLTLIDKEHGRVRDRLQSELSEITAEASSLRQCLIHAVEQVYAFKHASQDELIDDLRTPGMTDSPSVIIDSDEIIVPTSIGLSAGEVSEILSAVQTVPHSKPRRRELPSSRTARQRSARSTFMEKLTRLVTDRVDLAGVSDLVNTLLR